MDGEVTITGKLKDGATVIAEGTAPVKVKLPKATSIEVKPAAHSLALYATDPAATIKMLPLDKQVQVLVHYENGTKIDFTNSPDVKYDDATGDPNDIVSCTATGLCKSKVPAGKCFEVLGTANSNCKHNQ